MIELSNIVTSENIYLGAFCFNGRGGYCALKENGDFVLGSNVGLMNEKRALLKAFLEAVRFSNPLVRTEIQVCEESIILDLFQFKKDIEKFEYSRSEVDLWQDIFKIMGQRINFIDTKYVMKSENEYLIKAEKMARKASGAI